MVLLAHGPQPPCGANRPSFRLARDDHWRPCLPRIVRREAALRPAGRITPAVQAPRNARAQRPVNQRSRSRRMAAQRRAGRLP